MILLLASFLRFQGLRERGLLFWDEGKFSLEGMRLLGLFQSHPVFNSTHLIGKAIGTAKPTHALFIAAAYALLGVHDYSPLMMSAAASVLQVLVLVLLIRRLFGTPVALIAGTFLAISAYDVVYARSALSESDANLLFLLGVLVWWRASAWKPRSAAGYACASLLMGIAFTTNYRILVYIATLVAIDLIWSWRQRGARAAMLSIPIWVAGLVCVPALWQLGGLIAQAHGIILFRGEITYRPTGYLNEVVYQLRGGRQSGFQFNPARYVQWYVVRQGWPLSLLLLGGLVIAGIKRSRAWVTPALLVAIPFAVYTFAPIVVPRNLDTTLPFTA
ncbi:MAG: ArnT family glycosyltransferase, partial [Chloroflexota bacterium]